MMGVPEFSQSAPTATAISAMAAQSRIAREMAYCPNCRCMECQAKRQDVFTGHLYSDILPLPPEVDTVEPKKSHLAKYVAYAIYCVVFVTLLQVVFVTCSGRTV